MKLYLTELDNLFEMANIRGKYVKVPGKLDFSFYFSPKDAVEGKDIVHGLRVKPLFNLEKMSINKAGTLKLHGDWNYIPGEDDKNVKEKDVKEMKAFFRTYKVLFAAVWEKMLPPDALYDYFRGTITFDKLLSEFEFYSDFEKDIKKINNLIELSNFIRNYNLFNLWENN